MLHPHLFKAVDSLLFFSSACCVFFSPIEEGSNYDPIDVWREIGVDNHSNIATTWNLMQLYLIVLQYNLAISSCLSR